jgi:hypothetical protein
MWDIIMTIVLSGATRYGCTFKVAICAHLGQRCAPEYLLKRSIFGGDHNTVHFSQNPILFLIVLDLNFNAAHSRQPTAGSSYQFTILATYPIFERTDTKQFIAKLLPLVGDSSASEMESVSCVEGK